MEPPLFTEVILCPRSSWAGLTEGFDRIVGILLLCQFEGGHRARTRVISVR
jgi:hypothetical protein